MKLTQDLKLSQNLTMTPQLQQAIKLLTIPHLEMSQAVSKELMENPLLEEIEENYGASSNNSEMNNKIETLERENREVTSESFNEDQKNVLDQRKDEFDWNTYVEGSNPGTLNSSSNEPSMVSSVNKDNFPNYENMISKEATLSEHLRWQLRMENLTSSEWNVAELIIGNLNDDGLLEIDFEEIVSISKHDREDAYEILKMIQHLDPVGCATNNMKESLLVQAKFLSPPNFLVENIVEYYLEELKDKNYQRLAQNLNVSEINIKEAELLILTLNLKPGRLISPEETYYITPDVYVQFFGDEILVLLNEEDVPKLKISPFYKEMMKNNKCDNNKKTHEYVQNKLRSASWLIKSLHYRQKTILKVAQTIVALQPDFFRKGPSYLRPMILKDVAMETGLHESTISRVTVNKYMHTPLGTYELKYFFNAGIGGRNGGVDVASKTLKTKIKDLIALEDPYKPLSDQKISQILAMENIIIARRTIAKYREALELLPSSKRRKLKKNCHNEINP